MGHCAEQSAKCPEMCSPALSVAVEHHGTSVVLPPSPPASNAAESVHESYVTPRKVKGKTHVTASPVAASFVVHPSTALGSSGTALSLLLSPLLWSVAPSSVCAASELSQSRVILSGPSTRES
jgi:hypothetical protein